MIIDEIGTVAEVSAARTIAQRGVTLVGTAHGSSLRSLLKNPELRLLVGGVQAVILNADEARIRHNNASPQTQQNPPKRNVLERAGAPAFDFLVEVLSHRHWRLYASVSQAVDALLSGKPVSVEERWQDNTGAMYSRFMNLSHEFEGDGNWFGQLLSSTQK